jgi:hypothetical protein
MNWKRIRCRWIQRLIGSPNLFGLAFAETRLGHLPPLRPPMYSIQRDLRQRIAARLSKDFWAAGT